MTRQNAVADGSAITRRLAEEFRAVTDVTQVSIGEGGEAVYRAQIIDANGDSRSVFVREIATERRTAVRRGLAVAAETDIGIPDSRILDNGDPLLLMATAAGRPLSVLLPGMLLPGSWYWYSNGLTAATKSAGRYFGRLHTNTADGSETPSQHPQFNKCLNYSEQLSEHLSGDLGAAVETARARIEDVEMDVSCVFSDPTPHNVYYADSDVEFIDFTFQDNLAIKDLITFERGLELMASRLPYGRRSQSAALVDAFRDGYRDTGLDLPFDATYDRFRIVDYCYVLDKYLAGDLGGREASLGERLTRWTDVRACTARIDSLLEGLPE